MSEMADTASSLLNSGEKNIEMNGHSLDEATPETEQTKGNNKVLEIKDGCSKSASSSGRKILRKMSNGESLENSDCAKDNISTIDKETENNIENDHSEESDIKKTDEKNDSAADVTDELIDKSSDCVADNIQNKSDIIVTDLDDVKEKADDSVADATSDVKNKGADSDSTCSAKEILEITEVVCEKNKVADDSKSTNNNSKSKDDDDDCIAETINDDESDIEMIEESDPLAISDVDVKLAREQKMKKDSNLIVIDTNSILKKASSITITGVKSAVKSSKTAKSAAISTPQSHNAGNLNMNTNIQTALQAIAATSSPSIQGLQSAYATAIQQALLTQASGNLTNPQYANQLQQCYSSLGEMQDESYVIEAPSFIVPYVMEGKPKVTIKDYLEKLKKEEEEEKEKLKIEKEKLKTEKQEKRKSDKSEEGKTAADKSEGKEDKAEGKEDKTSDCEEDTNDEAAKKGKDEREEDEQENSNNEEDCEDDVKEGKTDKEVDKKDDDDEDYKPDTQAGSDLSDSEENKKESDSKDDSDKENSKSADDEEDDDVIALDKESKPKEDLSHLGKWEPFYQSTLGKFFMDLGLNQVEEYIQADLLRMTKRKLDKMKTNPTKQDVSCFKNLEYQLKLTREKNSHFNLELKTCKHCTFKTDSQLVMSKHLEAPHMLNYTYRCNFCEFETRGPQSILFHMAAMHNVKGRLERAPAFFQCPLCTFEENTKSKMTRHSFSCVKKFKPEKNCELAEWEPPAKIPKLQRGRMNAQHRSSHENVRMSGLFSKAFAGMPVSPNMLANIGSPMSLNSRGRGRPVGSYKNLLPLAKNPAGTIIYPSTGATRFLSSFTGANTAHQLSMANQVLQSVSQGSASRLSRVIPSSSSAIPNFGTSSSITIQSVSNKCASTKLAQQPSISITPLLRGQTTKNASTSRDGGKPTFVICEICDGYIKDLEQLRNHMNLIHKVKIHPKMIYNRPPLNCQKCQQRFFTDQGLERHLLGTHGLVTSSMQEAANKGKDSGRCPICGKVFQWKLLNHVSRDHKLTLKPAHLSYKCTVCTATFNMYRLFENHVYSAHSVVNKNKGGDSSSSNSKKSSGIDGPLKINDEITIIPQPSSKSKTDGAKSSKSNDTPSVGKEITITKVGGSRPAKKGGVEVISLDESPAKRHLDEPRRRSAKRVKLSQ